MDKNDARKYGRDIYEATEKDYDTSDYRRKLCNKWVSYQQEDLANLHEPTDLDSNPPDRADEPRTQTRKRQMGQPNAKPASVKKVKKTHMPSEFDQFLDFNDEPFFDYENRQNQPKDDLFLSKPGAHTKKHANAKDEKKKKSQEVWHGFSQPKRAPHQSRSTNVRQSTKRASDSKFCLDDDIDDANRRHDFDFKSNGFQFDGVNDQFDEYPVKKSDDFDFLDNFNDSKQDGRAISSTAQVKRNKNTHPPRSLNLPRPNIPERKSKPMVNFLDSSKMFAYQRIEQTNYMETPAWKQPKNDPFQLSDVQKPNKVHSLGRLEQQDAITWSDWINDGTGKLDLQKYVNRSKSAFDEPMTKVKKGLDLLGGTISNHNGSGQQPINIYCNSLINKLIIKTD